MPQHSFTKTGWCLCLRGIVACLLRLTCLSNRDWELLRTGCLRAGKTPAETPVDGTEELLQAAVWTGNVAVDGVERIVRARGREMAVAARDRGGVQGKGGSVSELLLPTQASLPGMNRATRMHQSRAQGRTEDTRSLHWTPALRRIRRAVGGVARRDSRVLREHRERVSASKCGTWYAVRGTRYSEAQLRSVCSQKPRGVVQRTREVVCRSDRSARGQTRATVDDAFSRRDRRARNER
jgi:hypothetical protein